jgi:glutamyl-tRNA reductase
MLSLTGVSHKTAPLEVRERLALNPQEIGELLPLLNPGQAPCVVLSTCNRTELYVSGPDAARVSTAMAGELAARRGLSATEQGSVFYSLQAEEAVRHLYRVASGLESLVVGEDQILGQVRSALTFARRSHTADALLVRLFESAVSTGRKLRLGSGALRSPVSVSAAAVELAMRAVKDLSRRSIVVVSAGDAGALTARSLLERGARQVTLAGRTFSRTKQLADELRITATPLHGLPETLRGADIAISATGARGYLIDVPMVATAMRDRPERQLLLIDLAVPRDIDPAVVRVPNVVLHDIDGLQPPEGGCDARGSAAREALEAQLDAAVDNFMQWWRARAIVPTIAALRQQAERIREGELEKTLARLPKLSVEDRRRIDALTSAIVNKLLHQPMVSLKESGGSAEYLQAVRELFALPLDAE